MQTVSRACETAPTHHLRQWMDQLKSTDRDLLQKHYFYSFWMFMHQVSPRKQESISGHENETVLQHILKQIDNQQLIVIELPDIIQYDEKYCIQNMRITLTPVE